MAEGFFLALIEEPAKLSRTVRDRGRCGAAVDFASVRGQGTAVAGNRWSGGVGEDASTLEEKLRDAIVGELQRLAAANRNHASTSMTS